MCGWLYKDVLISSMDYNIMRTGNYVMIGFEQFIFHDYTQNTPLNWIHFAIIITLIIIFNRVIKYYDRQIYILKDNDRRICQT